jgi:hypothetical protein
MDEVDDADLVVERVAALDLGKAGLEACVRVPHPQRPGRRMQELRGYGTTTAQLLAMAAWLRHWHVQRVVMESTSSYWKHPPVGDRHTANPRAHRDLGRSSSTRRRSERSDNHGNFCVQADDRFNSEEGRGLIEGVAQLLALI